MGSCVEKLLITSTLPSPDGFSTITTSSGFLVWLAILAREWGNAHALLYVTMTTVTFTDRKRCP
jgi:hypothetical protein